jgi:hypothetical protein
MPSQDVKLSAVEFTDDLREIKSQVESEAGVYADMPAEGKRKCLESLDQTIATLNKIKKDLGDADKRMLDSNVVQVLWPGDDKVIFTKEGFVKGFQNRRITVPNIVAVSTQDNFILDSNKFLKPVRMCFVKFSTEEEACTVLGLKGLNYADERRIFDVQFTPPTQTSTTRDNYRRAGKLVTRLGEIDSGLKDIGAVRECGTVPRLGPGFVDKGFFLDFLVRAKAALASGLSLDHHTYARLVGMRPVDTAVVNARIKALYDEECGILIQLRELQMSGVEFEFHRTSCI